LPVTASVYRSTVLAWEWEYCTLQLGFRQTTDHIGCLCTGIAVRIGKRSPTSQRMPGSTSDAAMGLRPQHSSPSASSLRFARSSMSEHLHQTCMSGELGCPHETQVVPVHDAHRSGRSWRSYPQQALPIPVAKGTGVHKQFLMSPVALVRHPLIPLYWDL
jgi:hypothetical protein